MARAYLHRPHASSSRDSRTRGASQRARNGRPPIVPRRSWGSVFAYREDLTMEHLAMPIVAVDGALHLCAAETPKRLRRRGGARGWEGHIGGGAARSFPRTLDRRVFIEFADL